MLLLVSRFEQKISLFLHYFPIAFQLHGSIANELRIHLELLHCLNLSINAYIVFVGYRDVDIVDSRFQMNVTEINNQLMINLHGKMGLELGQPADG